MGAGKSKDKWGGYDSYDSYEWDSWGGKGKGEWGHGMLLPCVLLGVSQVS